MTRYPLGELSYVLLTVLGFSFWFFMAAPFASHRESYLWLAMVYTQPFADTLFLTATTFRPLAQAATWIGFSILDPAVLPTSEFRQTLLQGSIYAMFVFAWGLIYSGATERRLFALTAFLAGAVFFSGYVHLFHIYGIFYVPVMAILGALLRAHSKGTFEKRQLWFASVVIFLVLWHPFASALFVGFYFGFYLDNLWQRSRAQQLQAGVILLVGVVAIATVLLPSPRTEEMSLNTRSFGFLVTYQTNEINGIASLVAWLMGVLVVLSMRISARVKLAGVLCISALAIAFSMIGLPLLFLWLGTALVKLRYLRSWTLFFLMLTAALLPFGGGIGTPIYGLFAIVVAVYVTPLGWARAEETLAFLKPGYVMTMAIVFMLVLLAVRAGVEVPLLTRLSMPLLAERERTYQLEQILAWLRDSKYCAYEISFVEKAGSPIDSVEGAITRRNRPPASLQDVQFFWEKMLRCPKGKSINSKEETAIVTFGGPVLSDLTPVFEVEGKYAGPANVWIAVSQH